MTLDPADRFTAPLLTRELAAVIECARRGLAKHEGISPPPGSVQTIAFWQFGEGHETGASPIRSEG